MRHRAATVAGILSFCLLGCGHGGGGGGGGSPGDADLSALAVSTGTLSPAFDAAVTVYAAGPGLLDGTAVLTPSASASGATITVDGTPTPSGTPSGPVALPLGPTPVAIVVTSADGTTHKTYTVVFTRAAPASQQAYVKASNSGASDAFGFAVSISGETMVVGALSEASHATGVDGDQTDDSAGNSGAAYVFVRTGATWSQQAYLKASNSGAGDLFGCAVSISGDTIVVGAYGERSAAAGVNGNQADNSLAASGAAYVFVRSGTTWSQQAYLKASNPGAFDVFGWAVSISGDTIAVGAPSESSSATGVDGNQADNGAAYSGAVYLFVRTGTVWSQQAYVKASNTEVGDGFGTGVAVSGDTVVVGAPSEASSATGIGGAQADNGAANAGAAYVFVRAGTAWSQQAYVKASNTGAGDLFGRTVAVSGDTIAVGASGEGSSATGVDGNALDNSAAGSGAAYVFVRSGTVWSQQAYLKASNTAAGDAFGLSVAVSGDSLVVGSYFEDSDATGIDGNGADNSAGNSGAAYVFARVGSTWSQQAYVKASNTDADDQFGWSVSVSGETIVVGAINEASDATGIAGDQADNSADSSGAAYVIR